ncbi:MAG TPA: hypothetical protein VGF61_24710 [Candidatus Acidoferrum sp.]|jgi:hypothetical protein
MEKIICRVTYWLGIASLVIALIWRALNGIGMGMLKAAVPGQTIYYMSFYKASLLFFVVLIASASYAWLNSQKP